ncbi:MAG: hypothetical protein IPK50_18980 [Fibrobacterota bacterium]|nr:MAG: hypothetical protein IPK50_18980 [Fibrobacterota bacterium]
MILFAGVHSEGRKAFPSICRDVVSILGEHIYFRLMDGRIDVNWSDSLTLEAQIRREFHEPLDRGWVGWSDFQNFLFDDTNPFACVLFITRRPFECQFDLGEYFRNGLPNELDLAVHAFDGWYLEAFSDLQEIHDGLFATGKWGRIEFPGINGDDYLTNEEMNDKAFGPNWREGLNVLTPLPPHLLDPPPNAPS